MLRQGDIYLCAYCGGRSMGVLRCINCGAPAPHHEGRRRDHEEEFAIEWLEGDNQVIQVARRMARVPESEMIAKCQEEIDRA